MKKFNKMTLIKYKKPIQELIKLGKKYDKEKDPEKQAVLKEEIEKKCKEFKEKLTDCSEEEVQDMLGISLDPVLEDESKITPDSADINTANV